MAALEPDRLVVRVVYSGAPMAGKTATVRALMPLLKGPGAERLVTSPAEHRGRTAFFDWADYEGGTFEGRPIHCQIASAPGQVALSDRRELLVRGADAVILVVDSQSDALERTLQCYEEMLPWLEDAGREAPIRVLLQCNKQDLAGSLSAAELSRQLGLPFGRDVYATSARTAKGLRAAFVAGVRAAVERARSLLDRGLIASAPEIAGADELFERMQRGGAERSPLHERVTPAIPSAARAADHGEPARSERRIAAASPTRDSREQPERARAVAARPRRSASEARAKADAPPPAATKLERSGRASAKREAPLTEPRESAVYEQRDALVREPAQAPAARAEPQVRSEAPPSSRPSPKSWTPGRGARPAVMPASSYYALVGPPVSRAEVEAWGIPEAAQASKMDSAVARASEGRALPESQRAPPVPRQTKAGRARPAVMPASAYLAEQARVAATREAAVAVRALARPEPAASAGAPDERAATSANVAVLIGPKRPAVMPASAYFALLRRLEAESGGPQPEAVTAGAAASLENSVAASDETPAALDARAEIAPPSSEPLEESRTLRPAVIPMAAWLSGQWTSRAKVVRTAAPRARPHFVRSMTSRPAVMPASAWRAMQQKAAEAALATGPAAVADEPLPLASSAASNDDAPSPESGFVPRSLEAAPFQEDVVGVPRLPGQVAPRSTWPRATWRELAPLVTKPGLPRRDLYGRFIAEIAPGWYARSLESVPDLRSARRCLAKAVLRQRSLGAYLSGPRCLALTEEADRFWVWQIVYRVPTLAVQLGKMLDAGEEPSAVADVLLEVATGYLQAREKFAAAPEPLPLSLQALSAQEGRLVYAGLLPKSDSILPALAGDGAAALEEALRRKWPGSLSASIDAGAVVAELERKAVGRLPDPIVEIIRDVLIRH